MNGRRNRGAGFAADLENRSLFPSPVRLVASAPTSSANSTQPVTGSLPRHSQAEIPTARWGGVPPVRHPPRPFPKPGVRRRGPPGRPRWRPPVHAPPIYHLFRFELHPKKLTCSLRRSAPILFFLFVSNLVLRFLNLPPGGRAGNPGVDHGHRDAHRLATSDFLPRRADLLIAEACQLAARKTAPALHFSMVYFTNSTLLLDQKCRPDETAQIASIHCGSKDTARSRHLESGRFLATFDAKIV